MYELIAFSKESVKVNRLASISPGANSMMYHLLIIVVLSEITTLL